jgi:autotransporter translocation and assembly factor TamB
MWRRLRRIGRVLAWIVFSIVLLALIAATTLILWARSPSGRRALLARATAMAQKRLRGTLTIGALDGDLTRTVVLRQVRLYDRQQRLVASVAAVHAEYDLLGLLKRQLRVRSLAIEGARVHVRPGRKGQVELTDLAKAEAAALKPTPEPAGAWKMEIRSLHGEAQIVVDPGAAYPTVAGQVTFAAHALLRRNEYDVQLERARFIAATPMAATLDVVGGVRWNAAGPALRDVRARFGTRGQDLDRVQSWTRLEGPLEANLRLDGPPQDIHGELVVTPARGRLRARGHVAIVSRGNLAWRAQIDTANLDPAALIADAPPGHIELRAQARGDAHRGLVDVEALTLDAAGTHAALRGRVELGAATVANVRAELRSPDLSRLGGLGGAALQGRVDARAHIRKLQSHTYIDAAVKARQLHVAQLRAGALDARIDTRDLEGQVSVQAHDVEVSAPAPSMEAWHLSSFVLRGAGNAAQVTLAVDASGRHGVIARVHAHGVPLPGAGRAAIDLALDDFVLGAHGQRWRLRTPGRLRMDRRAVAVQLALASGAQSLGVGGTVKRGDGRLDVRLRGRHLDAKQLSRLAQLTIELPSTALDVDARLQGTVGAPRLALTVDAATAPALHARVDAPLGWSANEPLAAEMHARGFALEQLRPLLPKWLGTLSGRADFDAHVSGTTLEPQLAAHLVLPQWALGDHGDRHQLRLDVTYQGERLEARMQARLGGSGEPGTLRARLELPVALQDEHQRLHPHLAATRPLTVYVRGHAIDLARMPLQPFAPRAAIHDGVVDVALDVHGTLAAPQASVRTRVQRLSVGRVKGIALDFDAAYEHRAAIATLDAAIDGARVLSAHAQSRFDAQSIADARTWRQLPISADVSIPAFDLAHVQPLHGTLQGSMQVRGTLGQPTGSMALEGSAVQLSGLRFARLAARAEWDGREVNATLDGTQVPTGALHLEAHLPLDARQPMRARLEAHGVHFAIDNVGRVRRLEGALAADLNLGGSRAHPTLAGFLTLDKGAFGAGSDPRLFHDVAVELVADGGAVELRRLTLAVGRGHLRAHSRATLDGLRVTQIDLTAEADRFPFLATSADAWLDAKIELHGGMAGDRFKGAVTVSPAKARLPTSEARKLQPTGPIEDVVYVDAPEPPQRAPKERGELPVAMDVIAHIPGPFKIESEEMSAELTGELELRTDEGKLGVYGHAETTTGRFTLLGRQYEIERVRASFNGDLDPVVDVRLTRAVADAKLIISVHGTLSAPQLELTSDPPLYDSSQVLGLIMSGDPGNTRVDRPAVDRQLAGAISGVLVGKLKGWLVPGLPIDVIKVDPATGDETLGGRGGTRIELGKFIRDNIYVSYTYQFGATMSDIHRANSHQVDFEYRPRRHFVLGLRYGDASIGAIDISWTLRY